jgi:dTDP-4-dehydrorhamnose 3,5-epimerase
MPLPLACLPPPGKSLPVSQALPPGCALVDLSVKGDARGSLIALEGGRDVPFDIARVYYVYATEPNVDRGFHAHRQLRQFAVAVSGGCTMVLDDGKERAEVRLDRPSLGLTIGPMVWREMREFTPHCVLLVLADALFDEADYIRDYEHFLRLVRR